MRHGQEPGFTQHLALQGPTRQARGAWGGCRVKGAQTETGPLRWLPGQTLVVAGSREAMLSSVGLLGS